MSFSYVNGVKMDDKQKQRDAIIAKWETINDAAQFARNLFFRGVSSDDIVRDIYKKYRFRCSIDDALEEITILLDKDIQKALKAISVRFNLNKTATDFMDK